MKQLTTFQEVNDYLSLCGSNLSSYNLDTIKALMEYLDNPQDKYKTIHIAGTSGKTSTAYFSTALLKASGRKVGLTISPVVDEVNERVQINLEPLSETEFTNTFSHFVNLLSDLSIKPSRFEVVIAFAFWYFAEQGVDYAVIEVGLGGLYDATNVISRSDKICLIADIGFDHMHVLGDTLSEISTQKAGIIWPGNEVFIYRQSKEVMDVIENKSKQQGAHLNLVEATPNTDEAIPDYQHRNWELAYSGYEFLKSRDNLPNLNPGQVKETQKIQVPARMDVKKYKNKTIILDGAHNPQKMAAFLSSFKKLYPGVRPAVLVALGQTKSYKELAEQLSGVASRVITTNFKPHGGPNTASLPAAQLATAFSVANCVSIEDANAAFESLLSSDEEILIITGSIYLISQLRSEIDFLK
jgi:dihydrofolate synthase/folylpolyglutamate synthase